jgi:DNA-binding MarR family transcriptional regulator
MQFLSREVGLEKGSFTTVIDSLEEKGLVLRSRGVADKRSFIITITTAGERLAERIDAIFHEHIEGILGKLTPEDRAEFERAIRTCARLVPILAS